MALIREDRLSWAKGLWTVKTYMFHTKVLNGSVVVKVFRGPWDIDRAWDWISKNVSVNLQGWD